MERFKKKIWVPIIIVVCLVAGYFGYQKIVEDTIASEIDHSLAWVQSGVDDETAEQILACAVPPLVNNEMISDFILENVSGEDVMDVYYSMMRYMNYEIIDVRMAEHNHYQATVRINNLNNGYVASHAFDVFMERYNTNFFGKISQGLQDLGADKSQLIAEMMAQSADDCYGTGDGSYWISSDYVIDIVKDNGEWMPYLDYESLIYSCLGLN